jgi:hypothetical protein
MYFVVEPPVCTVQFCTVAAIIYSYVSLYLKKLRHEPINTAHATVRVLQNLIERRSYKTKPKDLFKSYLLPCLHINALYCQLEHPHPRFVTLFLSMPSNQA